MESREDLLSRLVAEVSELSLDRRASVAYVRLEADIGSGVTFTDDDVLDALPVCIKSSCPGKRRADAFDWAGLGPKQKRRLIEAVVACDYDPVMVMDEMSEEPVDFDVKEACAYLKTKLLSVEDPLIDLEKVRYKDGGVSLRVTSTGPIYRTDAVVFVIDVSSSMATPLVPGSKVSRESHVSTVMPDMISMIPEGTTVAQILFSTTAHPPCVMHVGRDTRQAIVTAFFADREKFRGGATDIFSGFMAAANLLRSLHAKRAVVVGLTDGEHNVNTLMREVGWDPDVLENSINALFRTEVDSDVFTRVNRMTKLHEKMPCSVNRIGMSLSADAQTMEKYVDTVLFAETGSEVCRSFTSAMEAALNTCPVNFTISCTGGHTSPFCFTEHIANMRRATVDDLYTHYCGSSCSTEGVYVRSGGTLSGAATGMLALTPIEAVSSIMSEQLKHWISEKRDFPIKCQAPEAGRYCEFVKVDGAIMIRDTQGIDNAIIIANPKAEGLSCVFDKPVVRNVPLYFDVHAHDDTAQFLFNDGTKLYDYQTVVVVPATDNEEIAYARRKWQGKYMEVMRSRTAITRLTMGSWMADAPDEKCKKMVKCQADLQQLHEAGDHTALNAACNYRSLVRNEASSQSSYSQQHR